MGKLSDIRQNEATDMQLQTYRHHENSGVKVLPKQVSAAIFVSAKH
jgi:hypothetical protein